MMNRNVFLSFILLLVLALFVSAEEKLNQRFSGRVVDAGAAVPGFTATFVTITIEKYNTDDEVTQLAKILAEKGPDGLLKAIQKMESGRIRIGNRLSYPLAITRTFEKDGKRVIRAMTDRPIAMIEAWRDSRSTDYPFGFIEIVLDSEGKGEGVLIAAAKIQFQGGKLEMESYGRAPFRLMNITAK